MQGRDHLVCKTVIYLIPTRNINRSEIQKLFGWLYNIIILTIKMSFKGKKRHQIVKQT